MISVGIALCLVVAAVAATLAIREGSRNSR